MAKNLGATFDDTMSLQPHITALVKSCNFHLRSIGQARKYFTQYATEKILHTFVSSRLHWKYIMLWTPRLPDQKSADDSKCSCQDSYDDQEI